MERRKAITVAATASLTLLAGAGGIALSSGILGASADDGVGQISPVGTGEVTPVTVYVDEPSVSLVPATPPVGAAQTAPVTTSTASSYRDDDRYEDDDRDDEDQHDDDRDEGEEYEYEGADDDD